jgi:peptidoglycan/LPS O-acetylase OafA/YrhL
MPMLWLAVILFFVLDLLTTGKTPDFWQVASTVTLLPNATSFAFQNIAVPGTWSIVSEACFYLLFPLIVVSVATLRQTAVLFLASMVAAALCWPFLVDYAFWTGADTLPHAHNFAFLSPPTQLPSFAAGLVAFMLIRDSASFAKTAAYFGLAALPLLALGGTYAPIYPLAIGAFGLIAVGLAHGHLSFLVNRPMRLLGVISYSVYYWHLLVIALLQWIDPDIGPILKPTLVLALALPAATLTYLIVERPMIRSGARLGQDQEIANRGDQRADSRMSHRKSCGPSLSFCLSHIKANTCRFSGAKQTLGGRVPMSDYDPFRSSARFSPRPRPRVTDIANSQRQWRPTSA